MRRMWTSSKALVTLFILAACLLPSSRQTSRKTSAVIDIHDPKEFKKLLKTTPNVLCLFVKNGNINKELKRVVSLTAEQVRGVGSVVYIDCSGDGRKICKKYKVAPEPSVLKHYKDGAFHKDYDRKLTLTSMVNFMRDPAGDLPWEEDATAEDVVHLSNAQAMAQLLKKEDRVLVMFYAPWCGFCKRIKPEYASAATEVKEQHHVMAAIDVNQPDNYGVRTRYNITGFPTLLYFVRGNVKYTYDGEYTKDGLVKFMESPGQAAPKPKEEAWADTPSDVVHLTDATFDEYLKGHPSVLVMFYAPWCGHCKRMKPQYQEAATALKQKAGGGVLAAVDATEEKAIGGRFDIKGYPTVKYFRDGEFAFDVSVRDKDKILEFMADPQEPPPPPPPEKAWAEEASDVHHLTEESFKAFLKKKKHVLVMFYAPWCGHCKKAKPEFQAAAAEFTDDPKVEFAAVDCTVETGICNANDVKGYPTLKYYNYYKTAKAYEGGRTKTDFIKFMRDPSNPLSASPPAPAPEEEWGGLPGAERLRHLTDDSFDATARQADNMLVMFYAPWCGHCKRMKPAYAEAAAKLAEAGVPGVLATVDATVQRGLHNRFDVRGFPTLKHFRHGKFVSDYTGERTTEALVAHMRAPPTAAKTEL
ncbi:protein disulfide-isomerase A5-like [Pollicipes pollicipes]|uniref:protein disulfide-isomerase A5-like n=1 Tax=Pollicipes pollicipes TaxID=41117 RepID=UPI0018853A68|nr:protein disulfide-isomerase A5-like [Pollicipes pollicipes]XP_037092880.1 protein disulfide-isomerase A5-like [Pollicipes pollicipes]XP_037092881.1 protein disulfide-isomerase A5-like [Pollicipes pollicipes]XP_037092882.1 protein disulfide-isomerase A5-like [Pollicipes pollicipes]XP_037092883.1 protein disulfide-isomerase A5-like [Pollicipes pollicipes]